MAVENTRGGKMDEGKIKVLEKILQVSQLIEQCQTSVLITPEDRKNYFKQLNDKAHSAIDDILA